MILLRRFAAALCALSLGAAVATAPAFADDIDLGDGSSDAVTGIAWDGASGEVLLTDESGSITAHGATTGDDRPVTFAGKPDSVQALSLFNSQLYIGDVGDQEATRKYVTVFRVDPASDSTNFRAWDFSYPEGPQDAKAMAVSGKGRIYVVTGGENPGIYRAGLDPSRSGVNPLVRSADAPAGVTDAVFLDDGSTLMLRTGDGVELVDGFTWEQKAATTYVDAPSAESITTFGKDRMLVGGGSVLRDEPLPDGLTTVTPAVTATAPPTVDGSGTATAAPTATGSDTAAPDGSATSKVSRTGTLFALLGAAVVAILAGVVVFVARD